MISCADLGRYSVTEFFSLVPVFVLLRIDWSANRHPHRMHCLGVFVSLYFDESFGYAEFT